MAIKIATGLVILLFVLEVGGGYFLHRAKSSLDSITSAVHIVSSQNDANPEQLPIEDVAGADVPGITRFSALVRTKYQQSAGLTTVEYQTHYPVNQIISYYKSQLAKNDWVLDYAKEGEASFTKADQKIIVSAKNNKGITYLTISY